MTSLTVDPAPGGLKGRGTVPGDKSISHRALLLAARAAGTSRITGLSTGADVVATRRAIEWFGAAVERQGSSLSVRGCEPEEPPAVVDVGNSGTGIRLLAGWAAGIDGITVLQGDSSVARRPMGRVAEPLRLMGAAVDGRRGGNLPPLVIRGGHLHGIDYEPPVPSAQVKGAVLLAGLSATGPTTVREAVPTRAHTEEMLPAFGAEVVRGAGAVTLHPGPLSPAAIEVPGDPSAAAFWVVAACTTPGSDIAVEGVYVGPQRATFLDVLRRMGADIEVEAAPGPVPVATIRARYRPLAATEVGGEEIPGLIDEIPILAVAAAMAEGTTVFRDAAELKLKETDRIQTAVGALRAVGARSEPLHDGLVVQGSAGRPLAGGAVDPAGDHRIAMAMAVAALAARGPVTISGWEAVGTSYPGFESDLVGWRR